MGAQYLFETNRGIQLLYQASPKLRLDRGSRRIKSSRVGIASSSHGLLVSDMIMSAKDDRKNRTALFLHPPLSSTTFIMRAYYYDNLPGDQRLPHDYVPSRPVSAEKLAALNVKFWTIPVEGYEPKIDALAIKHGYKNRDTINCSKAGLGEVRGWQ